MDARRQRELSKYLSWVLRHRPDALGLSLAPGGWLSCQELRQASAREGFEISPSELVEVVVESDKQRFELSGDGGRLRAVQGHSVDVELGYAPEAPPELMFHGTGADIVGQILRQGLRPGRRQHVHLSGARPAAQIVARRRKRPTLLVVRSGDMARDGHELFRAPNGVWLTKHVPPEYLSRDSEPPAPE